jgi:hypothetical protein
MIAKRVGVICQAVRAVLDRQPMAVPMEATYRRALVDGAAMCELQWLEPRADVDPMTGQAWAFPWSVRAMTRAEFEATSGMEIACRYRNATGPTVGDSTPLESTGKSRPNSA